MDRYTLIVTADVFALKSISAQMFVSVNIVEYCSYKSICVNMLTSDPKSVAFSAYLTRICPYLDLEAPPAVSIARYWQFVTDTYYVHICEHDMLR